MPSPKRLTPSGLTLFNRHFGITKPNGLGLVPLLRYHYELLRWVVRGSLRLVVPAYARAFQLWVFFLGHQPSPPRSLSASGDGLFCPPAP